MPARVGARAEARAGIDIDGAASAVVMTRYHLTTKREAVNSALRALATKPLDLDGPGACAVRDGTAISPICAPIASDDPH